MHCARGNKMMSKRFAVGARFNHCLNQSITALAGTDLNAAGINQSKNNDAR